VGSIVSGTYTFNTGSTPQALSNTTNNWTLIGNPYPAAVSWSGVSKTNVGSAYYVWDPNLSGINNRGAYASYDAITNTTTPLSSSINNNIQSGQAIFVQTTGSSPSIVFTEANKTTTNNLTVFGVNEPEAKIQLAFITADNIQTGMAADGIAVVYRNSIAANKAYTVEKFFNPDENISINNQSKEYSIVAKNLAFVTDTIFLHTTNLSAANYLIRIVANDFAGNKDARLYLLDTYNNTKTNINISDTTDIPVTAAASDTKRWMIVVNNSKVSATTIDTATTLNVNVSNTANNWVLHITAPTTAATNIRLLDLSGKQVYTLNAGNVKETTCTIASQNITQGLYLIEVTHGNEKVLKKVVK